MVVIHTRRQSGRRAAAVRRHLAWIAPLLLFLLLADVTVSLLVGDAPADPAGTSAEVRLMAALITGVPALVVFCIFCAKAAKARRYRRHVRGRFTPREQAEVDRREAARSVHRTGWEHAAWLRRQLLAQEVPPTQRMWDLVLRDGEVAFMDTTAQYSRYYGKDVTYQTGGGFFLGSPLFVAAAMGVSMLGDAAARASARAEAATQWREHQECRLVVTNQRLACQVNGEWLSFFYGGMVAVYPEVDQWTLVCQFHDAVPLAIKGPAAPSAAVVTTFMTHGREALAEHPRLLSLGPSLDAGRPADGSPSIDPVR